MWSSGLNLSPGATLCLSHPFIQLFVEVNVTNIRIYNHNYNWVTFKLFFSGIFLMTFKKYQQNLETGRK
jgi:hypothetical protein